MGLIKPAKIIISKASESRLKFLQAEELKIQDQIKNSLEDLESNKKAAEREGQRLIEIKTQVDNEAKKLACISEEISKKQETKKDYEIDLKKIEQCRKELEELANKKTKYQNSQGQLIRELEDKKTQLCEIISSLNKTNSELDEKTKLRDGMSKDIATKSDLIYELNKDMERLRREKDQILQDKKFIERAKEEIPNYEIVLKDIESSRSIKKSLTEDLKLLDSRIESKKKEIQNLDRIIREKRTGDFELTEKLGSLRREIAKENARINSEKNKLITIKTEIQDLILEYRDKIKSEKLGKLVNKLNGK